MDGFLNFTYYTLAFLIVMTVLVFIHELGHYLMARWVGVTIEVFSIGIGPEFFGWTDRAGTRWKVSALPFGGYVKMLGDADISSTTVDAELIAKMTDEQRARTITSKSLPARMAVSAAGPLANFLLTIIVLTGVYLAVGMPKTSTFIGMVQDGGAASAGGLQSGDHVRSVDGQAVVEWTEMLPLIQAAPGKPLAFVVTREGQDVPLTITPEAQMGGMGRIGVGPSAQLDHMLYESVSPFMALPKAIQTTGEWAWNTLCSLGQMIVGKRSSSELRGFIGIGEMAGDALRQGTLALFMCMAMLSMSLGLLNLFPIPVLDGGHILLYTAEAILGRPLSERVQEIAFRIGLACVLALLLYSNFNDIMHLKIIQRIAALFG